MEKVKEILKRSLLLLMIVTFSANILGESVLTAHAASNPLDTIRQYIDNMGHDWNKVANLFTTAQVDSYIEFFNNEDSVNGNVGILNVNNAELVETVEVLYDDVKGYLSWDYSESESKFYAVGVDYSVNEDSVFYSNGISYDVISLILENNKWKIGEVSQISMPEELLEKGYVFSNDYENTVEMMEARQRGILINGDGEMYDTIGRAVTLKDNSLSDSLVSTCSDNAVNSTIGIPKSTTPVCIAYYDYVNGEYIYRYYVDSNGNAVSNRTTIPFKTYCIGAAAGECGSSGFNGTARQAIIVAIKTFTWYAIINPQDKNHGVNILVYGKGADDPYFYTGNQAYRPKAVAAEPCIISDYNAVSRVWMQDADNKIFKAFHRKGEYSTWRSIGKEGCDNDFLSQLGCTYLVDNNIYSTIYQLLRYYYDDSRDFNGPIKFFYK